MITERLRMTPEQLHDGTGWEIKPEGACQGDRCVPLPGLETAEDGTVDVALFAERMKMPLAVDEQHGLWALGAPSGGRVLASAALPEVVLPDFDGNPVDLAGLRGRKVLLLAWASW
jgi:hypothetical protein